MTIASRPTLCWSKISLYGKAVLWYMRTPVMVNLTRVFLPLCSPVM
jgi:hypothetical protein